MSDFLAQVILATRDSDGEGTGWMQLLTFVIIGIIYALSGIIKAKSKKIKLEDDEPSDRIRTLQGQQLQKRKIDHIAQPDVQRFVDKARQQLQFRTQAAKPPEKPATSSSAMPPSRPKINKPAGPTPQLADEYSDDINLVNLDEPDDLKKAILHYEILSKPLSLRN